MNTLDDAATIAECTPRFDWCWSWHQWGIGIALFPRGEYGIELQFACFIVTYRWRHGWRKAS